MNARTTAIVCALIACAAATLWQWTVARYDYGGNWTAFYRTGAKAPMPALAKSENLYLMQGAASSGYDGQFYRIIAQDPFLQQGTARYIDAPRLRYRRILIPILAWIAAAGDPLRVTYTYILVVTFFLGLGIYWLSRYVALHSWSPWWGLAFALTPAAFISIDRLTVDISLAALTVAFALYFETGKPWKLYLVLVLAPLAKETGVFLIAGYCLHLVFRAEWKKTLAMATAGIPALLWFVYIQLHTSDYATAWIRLPFGSFFQATLHPGYYVARRWYITPFDYLAWVGFAAAIILACLHWKKNSPVANAAVMFAVLAATIDFNVWEEVEAYGRAFTPLLILLPMSWPRPWALAPLAAMLPRALVFLLAETVGVVRAWIS